jgi:hypothetical protein
MRRFRARAGAFLRDDESRADIVVVAEQADGGGRRLEVTRGWDVDDQDRSLGLDTYCLCLEDGATTYGGVTEWSLEDARIRIRLDDDAARALAVDGFAIDISELPDRQQVAEGCRRVLGGSAEPERVRGDRPMTDADVGDPMNDVWERALEEAAHSKDWFVPQERMYQFIVSLHGDDRSSAERTLGQWALSDQSRRRFIAQAMIREFHVRQALPALRQLSERLHAEQGPAPRDENEKVQRLIDKLEAG